jgi:hypothetical protein
MDQQSEFEDQEHSTQSTQQQNLDPREQSHYQEPKQQNGTYQAYQAGYAAAMQQHMEGIQGQKIYSQVRQRRRRRPLLIVAAIIFILLLMYCGFSSLMSHFVMPNFQTVPLQARTFDVRAMPKIILTTSASTVIFQMGSGNTVNVTGSVTGTPTGNDNGNGSSNLIRVDAQQDSNANAITINEQASVSSMVDQNMTLDITLPANSNIDATLSSGDISINGISGTMNVKANYGDITFQNGTLAGTSSFYKNSGTITFHGLLAANGDYTFENDGGPIDLTLPANSAFLLDTKNNVNNDFNSPRVGTNPTSHLHLKDSTSDINIHKQ